MSEGYSGSMEQDAMVIIFKRSKSKLKLRYTSFLDTKCIDKINKAKPYGPRVTVTKEECVGHVAKHLYSRMKHLCQKGAVEVYTTSPVRKDLHTILESLVPGAI